MVNEERTVDGVKYRLVCGPAKSGLLEALIRDMSTQKDVWQATILPYEDEAGLVERMNQAFSALTGDRKSVV